MGRSKKVRAQWKVRVLDPLVYELSLSIVVVL